MRLVKRVTSVIFALLMFLMILPTDVTEAAKKPAVRKKISVNVGKSIKLKVRNASKNAKVTWKIKNKKVAKLKKKVTKGKKASVVIKGVKKGMTKVTAAYKSGSMKLRLVCKVTVRNTPVNDVLATTNVSMPASHIATPVVTDAPNIIISTDRPTATVSHADNLPIEEPVAGHTDDIREDPGSDSVTTTPAPTNTIIPTDVPVPAITPVPTNTPEPVTLLTMDCSKMTLGGSYAGVISTPFEAVALYSNGDRCSTSYTFSGTNKIYKMTVWGASNNTNQAGVSIYIGGVKRGTVSFSDTSLSERELIFKMKEDTGKLDIEFVLENDNGSSDTYVKSFVLEYIGDIPPLPKAPDPVTEGAAYTDNYRNLFKELGYSDTAITDKINGAWQQLFYGDEDEKIYYPVDDDMAYIYTADTNDVRSEGMSYGMMICVQMNKKMEFDRLWKWAKTYMQYDSGEYKDYFAWKCSTSGSRIENTPATDGEEYFATALLFAQARWGNGSGIYNYGEQAQIILNAMLHQSDDGVGVNMFDSYYKMPVFCPIGNAATYTDPSYHLPAFYEVWCVMDSDDALFWNQAAKASREYFKKTTNSTTGLGPDYSEYDGTARHEGTHADFRFDAWRIAANIACDYAWWGKNDWAITHADTIQQFFYGKGMESYGNQWSLDGTELDTDHSPGLVAMNAVASLAASQQITWEFVQELWDIKPTTGKYRYYDGCLYMMGLLHVSGNFRAYFPDGVVFDKDAEPTQPPATSTPEPGSSDTGNQISAVTYSEANDITVDGDVVTFNSTDSWIMIDADFGANVVKNASVYVKEPDNSAQIQIYADSLSNRVSTIYNLGNGKWNTTSNNCSITSGTHKIYIKATKANVQIKWISFS